MRGGLPGLPGRPGLAYASGMAARPSVMFKKSGMKTRTNVVSLAPVKVRKSFPETFIFESLDDAR